MEGILEVIALAHEYSLETRIRRLVTLYEEAGTPIKTLVMSQQTVANLADEHNVTALITDEVLEYKGLMVLVKDEIPEGEVVVGV